ncbi:flavin-binding protein [Erythrobacteraceae bacterium CFH 75059]|nr:flavin-binding protein [Erythrobacteraceae bacterium CFH 75059]
MHVPAVATADARVRGMVLRGVDTTRWTLRFHTDSRAPKARIIETQSAVGVLFYDREARVQIRCQGTGAVVRDGAEVDAAWEAATAFARRCYLGLAPGAVTGRPSSGLPDWVEGVRPTEEQLLPARRNFAILSVTVDEIDWFTLAHTGHRRAVFRRDDGWRGEWIAP